MDEYLSERQQVEQVKAWVKENAAWAVGGVVIGFALLFGMKQWNLYTARQAQGAAEKYQTVLQALSSNKTDDAEKMIKDLRDDYSRTPYADLATLAYVRFDVESGHLEEAAKRLEALIKSTHDPELTVVARLRLARVQASLGKFDDALKTLGDSKGAAFDDVRGDVLFQKGDRAGAVEAWNSVLGAGESRGVDRPIIELKIGAAGGAVKVASQGKQP